MAQIVFVEDLDREGEVLYDSLTGLPGPLLVRAHLHSALRRALRHHTQVAVLALDIDDFADLDARIGRELADEVLVVLAARIQAALRGTDVTARLDADDFLVVCEDLNDLHDLAMVARRVADVASTPMRVGDVVVEVRVSLGAALSTGAETAADLVRLADAELQRAQRANAYLHATG